VNGLIKLHTTSTACCWAGFEKRRAQLQSPVLKIELKNYTKLGFIKVALRPMLIKDLPPIATTSSQHSSKPHVGGSCF